MQHGCTTVWKKWLVSGELRPASRGLMTQICFKNIFHGIHALWTEWQRSQRSKGKWKIVIRILRKVSDVILLCVWYLRGVGWEAEREGHLCFRHRLIQVIRVTPDQHRRICPSMLGLAGLRCLECRMLVCVNEGVKFQKNRKCRSDHFSWPAPYTVQFHVFAHLTDLMTC